MNRIGHDANDRMSPSEIANFADDLLIDRRGLHVLAPLAVRFAAESGFNRIDDAKDFLALLDGIG